MKKLIALLLALVLCLSITACGAPEETPSEDELALEEANALMEAGEYQDALDLYHSIGIYQEISQKIAEAETAISASQATSYLGTWKDLYSSAEFTVFEDGTFSAKDEFSELEGQVYFDGDTITIHTDLTYQEIDGIPHLLNNYQDFVPEKDFEALGPKTVEITMENWETYFEMREAKMTILNDFGEVEHALLGYGVFLREEYVQKLSSANDAVSVSFKYSCMESWRVAEGDYPNDFTLGKEQNYYWASKEPVEEVSEVWFHSSDEYAQSDYYNQYAASIQLGGWSEQGSKITVSVPKDVQILDVTGSLILFP